MLLRSEGQAGAHEVRVQGRREGVSGVQGSAAPATACEFVWRFDCTLGTVSGAVFAQDILHTWGPTQPAHSHDGPLLVDAPVQDPARRWGATR